MTRVRVESFTISLDGYGAGPDQDIDNPLGIGGTDLHQWLFPTRTLQRALFGKGRHDRGGRRLRRPWLRERRGLDSREEHVQPRSRTLAGPELERLVGRQPAVSRSGFILTHHARPPIEMEGGTTFHFVTGGIHEALDRAREAANGKDVRIGGGREHHPAVSSRGPHRRTAHCDLARAARRGERLFEGVDLRALGYECVKSWHRRRPRTSCCGTRISTADNRTWPPAKSTLPAQPGPHWSSPR